MVATGSPEATEVAVDILEQGGNAVDAAVAAALTLGVTDSDASGIGGMTYIVLHLADGRTVAIDGTSHAPIGINVEDYRRFKETGRNFGYPLIAVPTTLATLEHARRRYGTLDMATLIGPAIEVAKRGYALSAMQVIWTRKYYENIMKSPLYLRYLALEDGRTIGTPGDHLCQADLANTYRRIASEGVRSFYRGSIADEIEADMIRGGSYLRKSDLARVRILEPRPLHTTYRGFDVFTFPPPGGGAAVISILNLLETFPSDFLAENSLERHHVLIEVSRIAAADAPLAAHRQRNFGTDPLGKTFARDRVALIIPGKAIPTEVLTPPSDPECNTSGDHTTQVSVVDNMGNVVSLTQTLSRSFGAKIATPGLGFPYNNLLEFFNADKPQCPGYLRPNSPCRSDMAPTIVLKDGMLIAALGAPGSNRIPGIVAQVISNIVDRGMKLDDAISAPRVLWGSADVKSSVQIEVTPPITDEDVQALEEMGFEDMIVLRYPPQPGEILAGFGGVNAVGWDAEAMTFIGVGDGRRWGSTQGPRVVVDSGPAR
jgi:gamma-glutamyltranspeptidase/glutathione hydrolase